MVKILLNGVAIPAGIEVAPLSVAGTLQLPLPAITWQPAFAFPVDATETTIIMQVRLPRILLAATVGFALAAAGTVMQGFFRNPMADPSIIGVSSGAAAVRSHFSSCPQRSRSGWDSAVRRSLEPC